MRGDGRHEQSAESWWLAARQAISALTRQLGEQAAAIRALAVDGTSGTIVCLDNAGTPISPGIMYNDARASEEAAELGISASFALARAAWLQRHAPDLFSRTQRLAHQADFVVERLGGPPGVTDAANALKTGYDVVAGRWGDGVDRIEGLRERLGEVVAPGVILGTVPETIAGELGLPRGVEISSGATDGVAAFVASGAVELGDDNTTLGTTLVFKRVAAHPVQTETVYSHMLAGGRWLPGAASNTGGEWIREEFPDADLVALDAAAAPHLPSPFLAWPLVRVGERFPFLSPRARGFCDATQPAPEARFAARLQGTALFERLAYEELDRVTGLGGGAVHPTGGGSRSDLWTQLRANVTGRVFRRPAHPSSAFGVAVLAAGALCSAGLQDAVRRLVRIERTFHPDDTLRATYDELYERFRKRMPTHE